MLNLDCSIKAPERLDTASIKQLNYAKIGKLSSLKGSPQKDSQENPR